MANTGKCPHCDHRPLEIIAEAINVTVPGRKGKLRGVNFICPACRGILGSELDPLALQADLVKKLRR